MSFRTSFDSLNRRSSSPTTRRNRGSADSRRQARRLLFEGLEHRNLLAFDLTNYATGDGPQAIVTADFNNDLVADIAVANYFDSTVSVLLGNPIGDGTFAAAVTSPTGTNPVSLAVGDFDVDGVLDIATANGYGYYGDVSVLLGIEGDPGKGTGTFAAPTNFGIGSSPTSVAVGDFNGDGLLDLGVTSNYYYYGYQGVASVLVGDGTGSFSWPNSTWLGYGHFTSAIAANLDGIGADELVTVDAYYGSYYGAVAVLVGDGAGFLLPPTLLYTGTEAVDVAAADVNGDNALDLVTANGYYNSVSVLLNNGLGGFGSAETYPVGSYTSAVVIGDFNEDIGSEPDILATNGGGLSVLYGRGAGEFSPAVSVASGLGAYALAADYLNNDSSLDVATANPSTDDASVLLNNETWPPPPPPPASLFIDNQLINELDNGTFATEFTVTRDDNLDSTVTVNFYTADGNALAGSDYVENTGFLTFEPGVTTQTITILVYGDVTDELNQDFYVNLYGATNADIIDSQGVGTIVDNDPLPNITINDVTLSERNNRQNTLFVFTVSLSSASDNFVNMNFAIADGTATFADSDYIDDSGTISIAPGTTTQTITVTVRGDKRRESNETFVVELTGATNGTILDDEGIGTIVNDDVGKGGGKGKPNKDASADLIAALLAEDDLTTRKRK